MKLIPVFPLPNVVLYPNANLALHIFEPRYRAMVEDALASDRMIAMANFLPEWEKDYAGNPAIRQVVCVGEITTHAKLKDGRFVMSLAGRYKADVLYEDLSMPYRRAELARIEERLSSEELLLTVS
ncbi:MAG: LON peptidase substrate-binding domain-containing protein [Nitrospinae bacterium]|nr:LON peptidase substrate-binding domain-containing protein [Nitrospinota bacterium]